DNGQVVFATTHGNSYLRQRGGTVTQLAFPAATATSARGVNNAGAVVGVYNTQSGAGGFVRNPDGTYVDLAPLLSADAINNSGTVVGTQSSNNPFVYY